MNELLVGILLSIIFSICLLPTKEGQYPAICPTIYPILYKGMIIIPYSRQKAIHIHHWIIFFIICISRLYIYVPPYIFGFSMGLCIQGLIYRDWYQIICDNPYKESEAL